MKRKHYLLLVLGTSLMLSLAGCNNTADTTQVSNTSTAQEATAETVNQDAQSNEISEKILSIKPVFLSKETAVNELAKEDDYIKGYSAYDYAAKFKSPVPLNEDERAKFYSDKTMNFTDEEKEKITIAMTVLNKSINELNLNCPENVKFIKTNGKEEAGAAYTRDENIILPINMLEMDQESFNGLVAHEFFHVYSRYNQEHRANLYELIGFKAADHFDYPESLAPLKISNPDAPDIRYYVTDSYNGKEMLFIPIIYSSEPYDIENGGSFFKTLELKMLGVELSDKTLLPVYENNELILVDFFDLSTAYENTGENTDYVIHPEEVLADNFALYVVKDEVKNQWIVDRLIKKMTSIK